MCLIYVLYLSLLSSFWCLSLKLVFLWCQLGLFKAIPWGFRSHVKAVLFPDVLADLLDWLCLGFSGSSLGNRTWNHWGYESWMLDGCIISNSGYMCGYFMIFLPYGFVVVEIDLKSVPLLALRPRMLGVWSLHRFFAFFKPFKRLAVVW